MGDQIRFSGSASQATLLVRALNGLIIEYFQEQNYEYTTSVFIPEANVNDYRVDWISFEENLLNRFFSRQ